MGHTARMALAVCSALAFAACARADEVILKNGGSIRGEVVSEDDKTVTVKTDSGEVPIPRKRVKEILYSQPKPKHTSPPAKPTTSPRPAPEPTGTSTSSSGPHLRAWRSNASGSLRGRAYSRPYEIHVELRDRAAAAAAELRFRDLHATTNTNVPLELAWNKPLEYRRIDRTEKDLFTKEPVQPPGGVHGKLTFFPLEEEIVSIHLRGVLELKRPDASATFEVTDLPGLARSKKPIQNALLREGKVTVETTETSLTVTSEGVPELLVSLLLEDGTEHAPMSTGSFSIDGVESVSLGYAIKAEALSKARLRLCTRGLVTRRTIDQVVKLEPMPTRKPR